MIESRKVSSCSLAVADRCAFLSFGKIMAGASQSSRSHQKIKNKAGLS